MRDQMIYNMGGSGPSTSGKVLYVRKWENMGMDDEVIDDIKIERDAERECLLRLDKRGRVTIPSNVRTRYGIDPEDDDKEYWVELTLHRVESRSQINSDDVEGDS